MNHYEILGIHPNSSKLEISTAFRKLAKLYHPDTHPNDKNILLKFQEISNSYQILSNPKSKKQFDQILNKYPVINISTFLSLEESIFGCKKIINVIHNKKLINIEVIFPKNIINKSTILFSNIQPDNISIKCTIFVKKDSKFDVIGLDLFYKETLKISIWDFLSSTPIEFNYFNQKILIQLINKTININNITIILKNQGLINKLSQGNIFIPVEIYIPELSKKQLKLINTWKDSNK